MRAKIIINPAAGANSTYKKWPLLSRLLNHLGLVYDHRYTEGSGHAIELAQEAASDGYRYLVAVGGDGTVNEVANGIMNTEKAAEVSLGVVSTGTGSDFARSAGIPMNWENAGPILMSPKRRTIDVGAVTFMKDGKEIERYFVNAAGIGFDASAVEATEKMPKQLGGTIPYMMGLLRTVISYRNRKVIVTIDDKQETMKVLSIMVANGNYLGGGMNVAPNALMDDKLFDVTIIGDIGKFNLMKSLPMLYNGTIGNHPKVRFARASTVSVSLKERILVQADGELLGEGPVSFRIVPAALNIVI